VVVLRVVLEHLRPLLVVKGAHQLFDADTRVLGPPLLAVGEPGAESLCCPFVLVYPHSHAYVHFLGELDIELAGAEESQLGMSVHAAHRALGTYERQCV
jgi:hypothetical protein